MQFIVEAAGIAHWVPICIAPPERGGGRLTVSTTGACSSGSRLGEKKGGLSFDQRSYKQTARGSLRKRSRT